MTTENIDICCSKCHIVTCKTANEWSQLGASLIAPIHENRYRTLQIARGQNILPMKQVAEDLRNDIVCEASCPQCENVLGQGFIDAGSLFPRPLSETIFYDETAIRLRNSDTQEEVRPIITEHNQQNAGFPTRDHGSQPQSPPASDLARFTSKDLSQQSAESREVQAISRRFAQQGMEIEKLSRNVEALQDRMFALEKSRIDVRTELRTSSTEGSNLGQDSLIHNFEAMLGSLKDARLAAKSMQDLRSENEQLKQRLRCVVGPTQKDIKNESSRPAVGTNLSIPSAVPSNSVKKKRPYTRRKPLVLKSATPAASDPDASFTSNHDQDDPLQLGSLAALQEITAAMSQALSTNQARTSNGPANHGVDSHIENSVNDLSEVNVALSNSNDITSASQKKRRRAGDDMIQDGDQSETYQRRKKVSMDAAGPISTSSQSDRPHEEPRLIAGLLTFQGTEPHQSFATQLQDAAMPFDIAGENEMMIDPALRSTSIPPNQTFPAPNVLSSIENPPDQRQTRQSSQQEKTDGVPQYDSVHEARIRDYKARDALRKRKSRAVSSEKKKMDGEDRFKEEEKIRARDRMVKELMEREEMLENDGDL